MGKLYNYLHETMEEETAYQRYARFGDQLGVTMSCIRKWAYGERRVPDDMKVQIQKITNGRVKIEDMVKG